MQIDFHFGTTYSIARMAGFEHDAAYKIAYSAQYVDDATNQGNIKFNNGAMYNRVSSAHKMLDYRNFAALANHYAWIPFHFLPGNGGLPAGKNPDGSFIQKIICRPNSFVAQDMVDMCLSHKDKAYTLQLLGITAHVYCDTWAHQGFAGVTHKVNSISGIEDEDPNKGSILSRLSNFFEGIFDKKASKFLSDVKPLGHGAALSHPDMPFLKWSFKDSTGKLITRNNTETYIEASTYLYSVFRRYLGFSGDETMISEKNIQLLRDRFLKFTDVKGDDRNEKWLRDISSGALGFDAPKFSYIPKGRNSWKYIALKTEKNTDTGNEIFPYDESFISCDWKLFHDALQFHRYYIIHDILPKYGICVA